MAVDTAPAELDRILGRVELVVSRRLDGLLHGDYQGLLPGHGSEPGEARRYEPGDDVRRIDWAVSARTQRTHVRESIADRELETTIVLDRSGSLGLGTRRATRGMLAVEVAAALGFIAGAGGNRVGVLAASGGGDVWYRHATGRAHVHSALRRAARAEPEGPIDLGETMRRAGRLARRRGFVAVVSDLVDPGDWSGALRQLAERHDVLVVEVRDALDLELPDVGVLTVVDPETGRRRHLDTRSRKLRQRYVEVARRRRDEVATRVRRSGADHLVVDTGDDWIGQLVSHLARRRRLVLARSASR